MDFIGSPGPPWCLVYVCGRCLHSAEPLFLCGGASLQHPSDLLKRETPEDASCLWLLTIILPLLIFISLVFGWPSQNLYWLSTIHAHLPLLQFCIFTSNEQYVGTTSIIGQYYFNIHVSKLVIIAYVYLSARCTL